MQTFTHKTRTGQTFTQNSKTRTYTHVVVATFPGDETRQGVVVRWSQSEAAAIRGQNEPRRLGWVDIHVEAINGGER